MYALTEDIKKEEVKEEEATETTEEVVEEVSEPSELEEAQARAEEFENVNNCKSIVAKIWQKRFCHHLITLNVLLPLRA